MSGLSPSHKAAEDLTHLTNRIRDEFGFTVHLCGEIEYSFKYDTALPEAFWLELLNSSAAEGVPLESIGREKTRSPIIQQYECRLAHQDPVAAAQSIEWTNIQINLLAKNYKIQILDIDISNNHSVCSGLHWHLHLLNNEGNYCFFKQEDQMSDPLRYTIGGLLATMPAFMPCFAPNEASYLRLNSGADHIPTTISWGGNNRSCAIRLPESVVPHRHIEHRVCGADADPYTAVWALLVGIHFGLNHQSDPGDQTFGDANRAEAGLAMLPLSPEAAEDARSQARWLKDYL